MQASELRCGVASVAEAAAHTEAQHAREALGAMQERHVLIEEEYWVSAGLA